MWSFQTQSVHKQRAYATGKRQGRKQGMQQRPPGPQAAATGCANSTVLPLVRSSLSLQARPFAWTAAMSLPRTQGQPAALESCSDIPTREVPIYHARYLPFDADISHNSDPRGRGKKSVYIVFAKWQDYIDFYFYEVVFLFWGLFSEKDTTHCEQGYMGTCKQTWQGSIN